MPFGDLGLVRELHLDMIRLLGSDGVVVRRFLLAKTPEPESDQFATLDWKQWTVARKQSTIACIKTNAFDPASSFQR